MAEPLKNLYNPIFFESILPTLCNTLPGFDERDFIHYIFDDTWPDLELKQRMRRVTLALNTQLPKDFPSAAEYLKILAEQFRAIGTREQGFEMIFLSDYIEVFGKEHFQESMEAIEIVTQLVSAEFAIRPFFLLYPDRTMEQMRRWSKHSSSSVRRLASEGCRPRLPWGIGVPWLKQSPEKVVSVLENLRRDPSEYVRRSVANNINDISKDHPSVALNLAKEWLGSDPLTDEIIRHGCRTLLRSGLRDAFRLHGLKPGVKVAVSDFAVQNDQIAVGETLRFSFTAVNRQKREERVRIDYAIDYVKSRGTLSRKVFRLRDISLKQGQRQQFTRRHSFADMTTRKHYPGVHKIHVIVNGQVVASRSFTVILKQR